jgi:cytochrome c oxidase subunit 2
MIWGASSALEPAGPQAARLAHVYWIFFFVCAAVYLVVAALLLVAISRRGGEGDGFDERRRLRVVAAGGVLTMLILVGLLVVSVRAGRGLNPLKNAADTVTVRVTARQWWWEFRYPGGAPDQEVTTANELHIPAGQPVLLELVSRDVIHSFWVPSLHGKRDLIPGHDSTTYIEADHPGLFRGQCAEFCGAQHAKMGFLVIADPPSEFQAWLARQRRAAAAPSTAAAKRGQALFQRGTCPMCHTVAGTLAGATMGPDLTHLGGRQTLGGGSLINRPGHLAAWIRDPHDVKPGNRMPPTPLTGEELQDLVAYLETLQ